MKKNKIQFFCFILFLLFILIIPKKLTNDKFYVCIKGEENKYIENKHHEKLILSSLAVLNDHKEKILWHYKEEENTYYLFLPKSFENSFHSIQFDCGANTYLSIYNKENEFLTKIFNEEHFSLIEEEYIVKLETNVTETSSYHVKIKKSNLPSLFIEIEGGNNAFEQILNDPNHETGFPGFVKIDDAQNKHTTAEIKNLKGRGNATWQREKKPFQMKLTEKKSLYGMQEAKTWLLLTNYPDGSLARNALWYKLANLLSLPYSPEFQPIDLYINNEYQGNYLLTSKVEVKENRVNLKENDLLLEIDTHEDAKEITLDHGYTLKVHYPELEKFKEEEKKETLRKIKDYLNNIESLIYNPNTKKEELEALVDLTSFAKYYWIQELSLNMDGTINSFYLYVKNNKLYAGPVWDMDATMNRSYVYTENEGYYLVEDDYLNKRNTDNWYRALLKKEYFSTLIDQFFQEYLPIFESLPLILDEYQALIEKSADMNYTLWPYERMISRQGQQWRKGDKDFKSSSTLLKEDLINRLKWLKEQYKIYDNLKIKIYEEEKVIKEQALDLNKANNIPKNATKVEIIGVTKEKEELIRQEIVTEAEQKIDLILKKRTTTAYKKYNQTVYSFTLRKEE